jgi:capsular polysaccharide biosynthesis protein
VLYIPKRPRNGSEVADFQKEFMGHLGSNLPIVCLDTATQVEHLIVPGQGIGLGRMIEGTPQFHQMITTRFGKSVKPEGAMKLYISRSALPARRGNLIGERALEAHLAAEGYTIYHPQKHDLTHQIATYKAAKQIIAAEGSSLHLLAMVAKPNQQVAIVVRRPSSATRQLEKHLQAFAGVTPVSINQLARSWKPLGPAKPRLWMGELDMPGLQAALSDEGFISANDDAWPSLNREEVAARLGNKFEEVA